MLLRILANVGIRDCMSLRAPHLLLPPFVVMMQSAALPPTRVTTTSPGLPVRYEKLGLRHMIYFAFLLSVRHPGPKFFQAFRFHLSGSVLQAVLSALSTQPPTRVTTTSPGLPVRYE